MSSRVNNDDMWPKINAAIKEINTQNTSSCGGTIVLKEVRHDGSFVKVQLTGCDACLMTESCLDITVLEAVQKLIPEIKKIVTE